MAKLQRPAPPKRNDAATNVWLRMVCHSLEQGGHPRWCSLEVPTWAVVTRGMLAGWPCYRVFTISLGLCRFDDFRHGARTARPWASRTSPLGMASQVHASRTAHGWNAKEGRKNPKKGNEGHYAVVEGCEKVVISYDKSIIQIQSLLRLVMHCRCLIRRPLGPVGLCERTAFP